MIRRDEIYLTVRSPEDAPPAARQLEEQGYVVLKQVFSAEETARLHKGASRVFDEFRADGRSSRRSAEEDDMFRYEMLNRSSICQTAIGKPAIIEVIEPLLGDNCHVIANTAWRNVAGFDAQHGGGGWHIDSGPHVPLPEGVTWPDDIPHPVFAIGVHIYLEDCGIADGPTGVIPRSHLSGRFPPFERYKDDELTWNGQAAIPLLAEAGDVALFVSDVWHRRLPTRQGDTGRFFLQVHYGRRDIAQRLQPTSLANQLSDESIARASTPREQSLIGLHPNGFYDG